VAVPRPGRNPLVIATDCRGHELYGIVPTIERLQRKTVVQ